MRVVLKLGTSVLTAGTDRLHRPRLVDLMRGLAGLRAAGHQPALVTSGAVLAGWEALNFPPRDRTLAEKQLLAAIGQGRLMHTYATLADLYDLQVAQVLLTADDFRNRTRYLNARTTLESCLSRGVLPVINENDAVTLEQIKLGDNDTLSAFVANLLEADLLVILTDAPGLYTADPRTHPDATLIPDVPRVTPDIWALAGGAGSHRGTGGMHTKIQAAEIATRAGTPVVIASGDIPDILPRLVAGERHGTRFHPATTRLEARKRWILAEVAPGRLHLDEGAARAIRERGSSLLPAGITRVDGDFQRGQTVRLTGPDGAELARGLTRYAAADLTRIAGRHSRDIEAQLGYTYGPEAVHRDDLIRL
ncbi:MULTISPECIES: glutamate 5-kinase [Deinococcus]|uniref:Glutamate 5-kinase n=2 Tax=Deinococcus TaxID=1298 RepID=A0A221SV53_9DEIO|nr:MULTISPECIES: glutamate 5-kinase [Deinococcus]ASN80517.1 glutamate 5-kinase [Deinococcus ficus]MDP9763505.1 glutamate 5-kinase [Deinococcus enclensis]GHF72673.1 glutamate 5-kinase [Deinococcus ficus]